MPNALLGVCCGDLHPMRRLIRCAVVALIQNAQAGISADERIELAMEARLVRMEDARVKRAAAALERPVAVELMSGWVRAASHECTCMVSR